MSQPPTSPALRERYDRRQQEVVATAAALFARRGFQATSMDELSDATGLRSGGLYHYIGSKQNLLLLIFGQLMDPLLERAAEIEAADADAGDAAARARARLARATSRPTSTTWRSSRRSATRSSTSPSGSRSARAATRSRRSSPAGSPPSASTDRLALFALLGMVNHTATWLKPGGRLTPTQIADGYCNMLLAR